MFKKILTVLGGDPNKKEVQKFSALVEEINDLEPEFEKLTSAELTAKSLDLRKRVQADVARGDSLADALDAVLVEAYAAVREASKRTLGLRPYDVQLIGGIALHKGRIAEMRTGEGKTLVATLPIYLNALSGQGVHLVTVNDYLARRDARWMAPVYTALGLTVGVLQSADRTENGAKAFIVDLEQSSPIEDQHQLRLVHRREAYLCDIVYGTNSEFGFDYLRDNLTMSLAERVQRDHYFAIVDEVDNILIDEARTPLIISGPAQDDAEWYVRLAQVVRQLNPEDYEINEKDRQVSLTEVGEAHVETLMDMSLRDPDRPEDITPEQARVLGFLEQALRAQFLYRRNKDYLVQAGKVVIVDEFTGRLMPGRRWSEGLHQAVEAKEGVKVEPENITYATITIQNYFRMYEKLAGMTGTAQTEAEEFFKIYKLDVLPIPTNLEYVAARNNSELVVINNKDEQGYNIIYYTERADSERKPVYWRRTDFPDVVFRTEEAKLRAICLEILRYHVMGRPQLVGTTSVEHSERLSDRLAAEPIRRLLQTVLIRQSWLDSKGGSLEREIKELRFLNETLDGLNTGEMRTIARSAGLDTISLEDPANLAKLLTILELQEEHSARLLTVIQGGIQHEVLNARKHDAESMIIARAGAFGAVTIATNMAGRGVDIKLGGELPEDILADVIRVLAKAGVADPYDLSNEERRAELLKLTVEDYGIYEAAVQAFLQYLEDMKAVRALGGLHVVGSERHEARRIDNQLRGRAARQGDPGSSRFYLSLEDELMRLFGGGGVEGLMNRLSIDPSMPIESGIIGRLVEQSQERVEGSNFDVRKHLLEYDDVLNAQRKRIYGERDKTLTKDDLHDDSLEMLHTELKDRIPPALKDEEGPWKLMAYLDEIQPSMYFENDDVSVPSFPVKLMMDDVRQHLPKGGDALQGLRATLIDLAERALLAEKEHLLHTCQIQIDKMDESLTQARSERNDTLDTFLESAGEVEEGAALRRPQELLEELSALVHLPLRLSTELMRQLTDNSQAVSDALRGQIDSALTALAVTRLIGAFERRLGESINLRPAQLADLEWMEVSAGVLQAVETTFDKRMDALLGDKGLVAQNIDVILRSHGEKALGDEGLVQLLMNMTQAQRMAIDPHTHQRVTHRVTLMTYIFLAAKQMADEPAENVTADVFEHLEAVEETLCMVWGRNEWLRLTEQQVTLNRLGTRLQDQIAAAIGVEVFDQIAGLPLAEIDAETRAAVGKELGRRTQNDIYRHILISVISELWVEYLTKVEALRISIGMEAYAQRNPLVEYKGKASEMFRELLGEIRTGLASRMFLLQPNRVAPAHERAELAANTVVEAPQPGGASPKKKRKRH